MTFGAKLLVVAALTGWLVAAPSASPPHYTFRDVALVTVTGHGAVRSTPRGINCPRTCRWLFVRGTHLRLRAIPAQGWRFAGFTSKWCNGPRSSCVFDLVSPHDCIGGACPVGAFGVRALFVRDT
ncbi:MAG: hypothetical protein ACXVQ3_07270 [Gaiellaceae bacterium]